MNAWRKSGLEFFVKKQVKIKKDSLKSNVG